MFSSDAISGNTVNLNGKTDNLYTHQMMLACASISKCFAYEGVAP